MTTLKKYISYISILASLFVFISCEAILCSFGVGDYCTLMVESVLVSPESATINVGDTKQFTVKGVQSDGSIVELSGQVSWSSSNPNVLIINTSSGSAEGISAGSATVTASVKVQNGFKEGKVNVAVNSSEVGEDGVVAIIIDLYIDPNSVIMDVDTNYSFGVIATYDDGTTEDVTDSVIWSFDDPSLGVILQDGFFAPLDDGVLIITAEYDGFTATSTVTIEAVEVYCVLNFEDENNLNSGCELIISGLNITLDGGMTYRPTYPGYGGDDGYVYNEGYNEDDYILFGIPVIVDSFYMTVKPRSTYATSSITTPYELTVNAYDNGDNIIWTELVDLSGTEDWSWVEVDVDTENIVKLEFVAPEHSIWPSVDKMTIGTK